MTNENTIDGELTVRVNGVEQHCGDLDVRVTLADWLRDDLGLTGTHLGCEQGVCGACTVLLDGAPVRSCLLFAVQARGHEITTIEAFNSEGKLHPIQQAFSEKHGLQCGFCTPGFIVTISALLKENPAPSDAEVRDYLSGNICRCTGYVKIFEAVERAQQLIDGEA